MTIGRYFFAATFATAFASAMTYAPAPSLAQSAPDKCIQQGHKPGSAGFYHCLQENAADDTNESGLETKSGEAESILGGNPQDAASDYAGSSMDGATKPDPNILKNFTPGQTPGQ
jgi:hypothetical protein